MTRIALVQIASPDGESRDDRIARVERMMLERLGAGIDLFVLPELWAAGYQGFTHYDKLAESLDGPTITMGKRVAHALSAWVHLGSFIERTSEGTLHNTAVMLNPEGEIASIYRKIHVFGYESLEAQLLTPGSALPIVDTPLGRTASVTCYDLRFAGLWLEMSERGAQAAVVPAAWPAVRRDHFTLFTEARAVENQMWVVAVNSVGIQGRTELGGCSRVVNAWGHVVAECSTTEEEIMVVDIDPTNVEEIRADFQVLADRLPLEQYRSLGH